MNWEKNLNGLLAIILSGIVLGALCIQIFLKEEPCPLCLLQRLGMLGVATGALMNIKFGPRPGHYALSLFSALFGGFVALRQILLHICPGFPSFGAPFWGLSLYVWSFIAFVCSVAYIALLLLIFDNRELKNSRVNWWGGLAFLLVFLASFINIVTTFLQCNWGVCVG